MKNKLALGLVSLLTAVLLPSVAFAEGGVKVECFGRCDLVNLGQVCDTYSAGSTPVAVSCDDTGVGSGSTYGCGAGLTCRSWGNYSRYDALSGYCDDGPGLDAIVTCRAPGTLSARQAQELEVKIDDGAGQQGTK